MMERMTAKVKLTSRSVGDDGQVSLAFGPDYDNGANQEWAKYTPSLSVQMIVKDDVLGAQWETGQRVTLVFEADQDAEEDSSNG